MHRLALWNSEWCGWGCCACLLVVGLPLFVCLPLWCDITLYDVAAWNVLQGGTHYRDVFDTNMPGAVWIHVLVRSLAGWSSAALRLFDLGVLGALVLLLLGFLRDLQVSRAGRAWFAVAVVLFYLFQAESCHCQRDFWMLLPAVLAVRLRCRRLVPLDAAEAPLTQRGRFLQAALEGCLWGLAIWIKPHVLIPVLAVWLVSVVWSAGGAGGWFRRLLADSLGLLLGGLLVGAAGVGWMLLSGTWAPFWDVFLHWNPLYWNGVKSSLSLRYPLTFLYFAPWSLLHFLALPVALCNLLEVRFWSPRPAQSGEGVPFVRVLPGALYLPAPSEAIGRLRALLAALYLGWVAQALFLQQGYQYVHVPELILALALLTAQRWPVGFGYLAWFAAAALVWRLGAVWPEFGARLADLQERYPTQMSNLVPAHPLADPERLALWPRCWREGSSPALRDRLAFLRGGWATLYWVELEEVAEYLRGVGIADGELVCWDDSTHPLYLMLGVKPSIRFMHLSLALTMKERTADIQRNLQDAARKRYVVSDQLRTSHSAGFPWDQPTVFRSSAGRYAVQRITGPIGSIRADSSPCDRD